VLEALITILLALHLLCVNAAAGGPLIAAWLDWRAAHGDQAAPAAARYLAAFSLGGLLAGALLGTAIGWLQWDTSYRSLWLGPLRYKLHWAGIEAVFSLVLLLGWWRWLPGSAGGRKWAVAVRGLLALLASSNLLYHFPVLFSVAARLYDQGQTAGAVLRGAGFRQQMAVGETPALAVHVTLASVAVSGVLLIGYAVRLQKRDDTAASKLAIWGGRWALAPTLAQLPVGLWTLAMLSAAAQTRIMGTSTIGVLLLVGSLTAAFWLTRELAGIAMGEIARPILIRSMAALLVTVVLMTGLQRQTRVPIPTADVPGRIQESTP